MIYTLLWTVPAVSSQGFYSSKIVQPEWKQHSSAMKFTFHSGWGLILLSLPPFLIGSNSKQAKLWGYTGLMQLHSWCEKRIGPTSCNSISPVAVSCWQQRGKRGKHIWNSCGSPHRISVWEHTAFTLLGWYSRAPCSFPLVTKTVSGCYQCEDEYCFRDALIHLSSVRKRFGNKGTIIPSNTALGIGIAEKKFINFIWRYRRVTLTLWRSLPGVIRVACLNQFFWF